MNSELLRSLALCETDIDGAMRRFSGNEALYLSCLNEFADDPTIVALNEAIEKQLWDDAFTAAHALKGLAGNMGFVPLFHAAGELVLLIRNGKIREIGESNEQVNQCYGDIIAAIQQVIPEGEQA